ncbi:MAG: hypothetical protein WDW36_004264 [Sanguina aurantia]
MRLAGLAVPVPTAVSLLRAHPHAQRHRLAGGEWAARQQLPAPGLHRLRHPQSQLEPRRCEVWPPSAMSHTV